MAEQLTPIGNLANTTPVTLIALANAIVNVMATTMVSANGSANGALTNGNGYVSGIFGAAIGVYGMIRGGNVQSSANLIVGSNTWINSGSLSVGNTTANATLNSINLTVPTANIVNAYVQYFPQNNVSFAQTAFQQIDLTTSGTSSVVLDSFLLTSARTAEYIIQVKDEAANGYQTSKFLLTHDGTTPLWTEYGLLTTNAVIATFNATANATAIALNVTPASVNTTIRAIRTTLGA